MELLNKKNQPKYRLSKEKRDELIGEIKMFFEKERDEEIGDLAADTVLNFFMEKIANEFYNQGVYDSYAFMNEKMEDLLGIQK